MKPVIVFEVTQEDCDDATPTHCPMERAVRRHFKDPSAIVGPNFVMAKGKTFWLDAMGRYLARMFTLYGMCWVGKINLFYIP